MGKIDEKTRMLMSEVNWLLVTLEIMTLVSREPLACTKSLSSLIVAFYHHRINDLISHIHTLVDQVWLCIAGIALRMSS